VTARAIVTCSGVAPASSKARLTNKIIEPWLSRRRAE
jgi:hypothetical protein